jgi:hypothetical protein
MGARCNEVLPGAKIAVATTPMKSVATDLQDKNSFVGPKPLACVNLIWDCHGTGSVPLFRLLTRRTGGFA